jgi:membrane-associated phospholipid phosphatase
VSGHSTTSGTASEVLAASFPAAATQLRAWAGEAAVSRLYGGIHFRSDNEAGLALGKSIAAVALARSKRIS